MWCFTCEEGTEHFFLGAGQGGDAVCCSGHEQASDLASQPAGRPGFMKSGVTFGSFVEARGAPPDLCRKAESLACQEVLPVSSPSPGGQGRGELRHCPGLTPRTSLCCGVVNRSSQSCSLALSLGRWREPRFWTQGLRPPSGWAPPHCLSHLAGPVLPLPPRFRPPLFLSLCFFFFACSLKLACGTQGQTHYSFSSMNVPFN